MFVEDLISDFAKHIGAQQGDMLTTQLRADDWSRSFIHSIERNVRDSKPLSSEQSRVFLNIANRYLEHGILDDHPRLDEIERLLRTPRYKRDPYQSSNMPKEVRYLGDNKLGFRCKKIEAVIRDIKKLGEKGKDATWREAHRPRWSQQGRMWVVSVNADTHKPIMDIISKHEFDFDDEVAEYLTLTANSKGLASAFVHDPQSGKIVVNICDNEVLESWMKNVVFGEML